MSRKKGAMLNLENQVAQPLRL